MAKDEQVSVVLDSGVDTNLFVPNKKIIEILLFFYLPECFGAKELKRSLNVRKNSNSDKMILHWLEGLIH